ncbi:unnamed protein product [Cuscuta epithymum]|uniref:DUF4283 domain-containing protein n=1 Tax=Cuscuta epithymum TaxID=186058 RepID=A0AAV0G1X5_9ASTE|nr:unnamed protein product [Cuscuta epithymum]
MIGNPSTSAAPPSPEQPPPPGRNIWDSKRTFVSVLLNKEEAKFSTTHARFKGMPSVSFLEDDVQTLADQHKHALVGYFYKGRPPLATIRRSFEIIGFKGVFHIGLIEKKHILIRFDMEEDYIRCWNRQNWDIQGNIMKVTKWSPDFKPNVDSPIVPVWLVLEGLPIHLHDKRALFEIAGLIGKPLKLDVATATLARPSQARVCVELDLTKEMPNKVWIQAGKLGFVQPVIYEYRPYYCTNCFHLGHEASRCPKKMIEGNIVPQVEATGAKNNKWVAKTQTTTQADSVKIARKDKESDQNQITSGKSQITSGGVTLDKGKAIVIFKSQESHMPSSSQLLPSQPQRQDSVQPPIQPQRQDSAQPLLLASSTAQNSQTMIQESSAKQSQNMTQQQVLDLTNNIDSESDIEEVFHEKPPSAKKVSNEDNRLSMKNLDYLVHGNIPGLTTSKQGKSIRDDFSIFQLEKTNAFDPEIAAKEYGSDSELVNSGVVRDDSELLSALALTKDGIQNHIDPGGEFITVGRRRRQKKTYTQTPGVITRSTARRQAQTIPQPPK